MTSCAKGIGEFRQTEALQGLLIMILSFSFSFPFPEASCTPYALCMVHEKSILKVDFIGCPMGEAIWDELHVMQQRKIPNNRLSGSQVLAKNTNA